MVILNWKFVGYFGKIWICENLNFWFEYFFWLYGFWVIKSFLCELNNFNILIWVILFIIKIWFFVYKFLIWIGGLWIFLDMYYLKLNIVIVFVCFEIYDSCFFMIVICNYYVSYWYRSIVNFYEEGRSCLK